MNAMRGPSGAQVGVEPYAGRVIRRPPPPAARATAIPPPPTLNAICRPPGDHAGSKPSGATRRTCTPSVFQTPKAPSRLLEYAIQVPSGDHVGCSLTTAPGAVSATDDRSVTSGAHHTLRHVRRVAAEARV